MWALGDIVQGRGREWGNRGQGRVPPVGIRHEMMMKIIIIIINNNNNNSYEGLPCVWHYVSTLQNR